MAHGRCTISTSRRQPHARTAWRRTRHGPSNSRPDLEFPEGERPHQVRLQGGDASSDSYCFPNPA
jgi:56kDa selenium binding protein (SBP56)